MFHALLLFYYGIKEQLFWLVPDRTTTSYYKLIHFSPPAICDKKHYLYRSLKEYVLNLTNKWSWDLNSIPNNIEGWREEWGNWICWTMSECKQEVKSLYSTIIKAHLYLLFFLHRRTEVVLQTKKKFTFFETLSIPSTLADIWHSKTFKTILFLQLNSEWFTVTVSACASSAYGI